MLGRIEERFLKPSPPADIKNGLSNTAERVDSPSCALSAVDAAGESGTGGETDARMRAIRASSPDEGGEDDMDG